MTDNHRSITVAAVQMDVQPAPVDVRLYKADQIVQDAVQLGAELIVLPELFNTGYAYTPDNYHLAEPADGATVSWLKRTARRMGAHLAGSLLLAEGGEIYNAMLIAAPDGRTWRYDKSYPWGWERAYFRPNRAKGAARAVVAKTDLGDLGMLICWDAAHLELWQAYAGQVDMMVICSCPPQVTNATFCLPPDVALSGSQLGPVWAARQTDSALVFGKMLDDQAAWLGVPVANSVACGPFESRIPNGRAALLGFASSAPSLLRYLPRADALTISGTMVDACRIVSAEGRSLAHCAQASGEGFALAEVRLPTTHSQPGTPQPAARISPVTYFVSDTYLPGSVEPLYRREIARATPS